MQQRIDPLRQVEAVEWALLEALGALEQIDWAEHRATTRTHLERAHGATLTSIARPSAAKFVPASLGISV
jgi:hypothetical protein